MVMLREYEHVTESDSHAVVARKMTQDLKVASATLGPNQARYLVDTYYEIQRFRITANHQRRKLEEFQEPASILVHYGEQFGILEEGIKAALKVYAQASVAGRWMLSVIGIGPVIAAGLLAHIKIERCPTAGHLWSFAGMDPSVKWEKGQKRPYCARMKQLVFFAGESFIKTQNNKADFYGKFYRDRKTLEEAKNDAGDFAETARIALTERNFSDDTDAKKSYLAGRLPQARIHARARRYAAKLFLAHVHQVMYEERYGIPAPRPYAEVHLGHAHVIAPPNWPTPDARILTGNSEPGPTVAYRPLRERTLEEIKSRGVEKKTTTSKTSEPATEPKKRGRPKKDIPSPIIAKVLPPRGTTPKVPKKTVTTPKRSSVQPKTTKKKTVIKKTSPSKKGTRTK